MYRSFKDQVKKLQEDLRRDLKKMRQKERKTFYMPDQTHEKTPKEKNRKDRHDVKQNLKRGEWDN